MTSRAMDRADAVTGVVLLAVGLGIVVESWRMPTFTDMGGTIWQAPGIVPGLLGVALMVTAVILLARALGRLRSGASTNGQNPLAGGWGRIGLAFALCVGYAGVLVGRIPFWLATFLFVLGFIVLFEWVAGELGSRRALLIRGGIGFAIAVLATAAVTVVFQDVFFVRLP